MKKGRWNERHIILTVQEMNKILNTIFMFAKSFYYLSIFSLIICSGCSKDDSSMNDLGMILGEWEGFDRTLVFKDGVEEPLPSENCEGHILQFFEDGRVHWVDFVPEELACVENQDTKPLGAWERLSNGKYIITLLNALDDSEIVIAPELVTFNFNGAETMDIQYSELPEDAPDDAAYYYLTLFRR